MSSLIITLPSTLPSAAAPCSAVLTEDGRTVKLHWELPLALLPAAQDSETIAVVPPGQLSWHRLELPPGTLSRGFLRDGNATRLRRVLDGLLEEQLLDETAQLHFALEPQARAGQPVWVAVCDHIWLGAWLAQLEQAGRVVTRIVPEFSPAVEDTPGGSVLHLLGSPEQGQLVWIGAHGLCTLPWCADAVALVAPVSIEPANLEIVAEPGMADVAGRHFQAPVRLQTAPQRAVAVTQSAWDLAQFDFLRTRSARGRKRLSAVWHSLLHAPRWRAARWAALALVVVNLAGLKIWASKEQSALAAKQERVRTLLTSTFPDIRVVLDAPLQMERSLAELQRQSGAVANGDFEMLLGLLQTTAPELQLPSANTIDFVAGELRLGGLPQASAALTSVSATLQPQGYVVRLDGDSLVLKPQARKP